MPVSLLQLAEQLQDLRLHRHVERGRRLVGDEQVGLVGERHGDHHALALAAGELVRIGAEPALRVADADLRRAARASAARAAASPSPWCSFRISPICRSMVCSGLSEVIGSWKIMRDVVAAHACAAPCSLAASRSLPLNRISPVGCAAGGIGQELQHRQRRDRLARAGLADQRHRLALGDVEGDALDRHGVAAALAEGDAEILDGEEGGSRSRARCRSFACAAGLQHLRVEIVEKRAKSPSSSHRCHHRLASVRHDSVDMRQELPAVARSVGRRLRRRIPRRRSRLAS